MYEADDGEYDAYESDEVHRPSRFRKWFGVFLLSYSVLAYGLAQTITLNNNNRVEFGQGVFTLKACDSFISVTLTPSSATYSGTKADGTSYTNSSRVKNIILSGLDTVKCAGKNVKVQLYTDSSATPMALYTDSGSLQVSRALFNVNSNSSTPRADALTVINGYGSNIGYADGYHYLDFNDKTAEYTLIFTYPLALVSDVHRVTIETSNA